MNQWINGYSRLVLIITSGISVLKLQCIDVNKSLRGFQERMYSAQYMTLAVISRGKTTVNSL